MALQRKAHLEDDFYRGAYAVQSQAADGEGIDFQRGSAAWAVTRD
jgi:hypothetical protein